MKNKKILFLGCSLTAHSGFNDVNQMKYHWPWLVSKHFDCYFQNSALTGSTNEEIFLSAVEHTSTQSFDLVIVMWSDMQRYWFYPADGNIDDYVSVPNSDFEKQYHKLHFAYFNNQYMNLKKWLVQIVSLQNIFNAKKQKFIFIKGFDNHLRDFIDVYYDQGFNNIDSIKYMLDFNNKPDYFIFYKIQVIKDLINLVNQSNWINFTGDAFCHSPYEIDKADDNDHPGKETNKKLFLELINHCTSQHIFG